MRVMQENQVDKGRLQVVVQSAIGSRPIERAEVSIFYTGEPDRQLEKIQTDRSGNSPTLELSAPPVEYSLEPGEYQPYSEYTLHVEAPGFEPVDINGTEILSGVTALQPVKMQPTQESEDFERIVIPAHTLFAEYPPKIPEEEIKPVNESGEIVLSKVVVPEFIVVHDGPIQDTQVENYYVRYKDYIKNVA
ncbi:MAG: peptidoglycan-binding protein, partial [Blautia sp.]